MGGISQQDGCWWAGGHPLIFPLGFLEISDCLRSGSWLCEQPENPWLMDCNGTFMKTASSRLLNHYVELKTSPLHGLGLFAKRDIPCGTVWWRAKRTNVLLLKQSQYLTLQSSEVNGTMESLLNIASVYGYYSARLDSIVICLDNARYVNHSFAPNSGAPDNGDPLSSMALRDIYAGEEITEDYASYDACPWCRITCSDPFLGDSSGSMAV